MRLVETKGVVNFYESEDGISYQKIDGDSIEKVRNGKMKYKYIKKVGNYFIQYNLNGIHGFCICKKDKILEDNIWDLNQAINIAQSIN